MSELYKRLPSEILGIEDKYTGYCLDEACAVIHIRIKNGESPRFHKKYKSFSDLYRNYGR